MQSKEARKEAVRKFKERKPGVGAYAIRCAATDSVWVGTAVNLESTRTRSWFALRLGGFPERGLQEEWNRHGEASFSYEVLETLEDDLSAMAVKDLLKEMRTRWLAGTGGRGV